MTTTANALAFRIEGDTFIAPAWEMTLDLPPLLSPGEVWDYTWNDRVTPAVLADFAGFPCHIGRKYGIADGRERGVALRFPNNWRVGIQPEQGGTLLVSVAAFAPHVAGDWAISARSRYSADDALALILEVAQREAA